jgi:hypothetical protein
MNLARCISSTSDQLQMPTHIAKPSIESLVIPLEKDEEQIFRYLKCVNIKVDGYSFLRC